MSVCPVVYLKNHIYFAKLFICVTCGGVAVRGSALPWRHCNKRCIPVLLSTSCFHITPNVQSDDADISKRVNVCAQKTKSAFLDCFVSQSTPEN